MLLGHSPPKLAGSDSNALKNGSARERMRVSLALGWPWNRPALLLAGAPRTGTSWTAKMLSQGRSVRYVHEPISHGGFQERDPTVAYRFVEAEDYDPEYAAVWRAALSQVTALSKRWLLAESRPWLRRVPFWPARLLVKEINCPLALEWLAENFPLQIVVTIRHPCGFVASGLRVLRSGDRFVPLERLLSQSRLVARYFPDELDWLRQLRRPVEQLAASYAMIYKVLADQLERHPEWILVRHEAFCRAPQEEFRRLFEALGIRYTRRADKHLAATTQADDGSLYSIHRNSRAVVGKWKEELSPDQIESIASIVARFQLPYYREFA
jgi:sulfotransferase family protein